LVAILAGFAIEISSPLKRLLVGTDAPLRDLFRVLLMAGDAAVPVEMILVGCLLATGSEGRSVLHAACGDASSARALALDCALVLLVRCAVEPLAGLALYQGALQLGLLSRTGADDFGGGDGELVAPLLRAVLLIEAAMPTGNNAVLLLNLAQDDHALSQRAAALLSLQLIALPLTLAPWWAYFLGVVDFPGARGSAQ
jgi:predicted permease